MTRDEKEAFLKTHGYPFSDENITPANPIIRFDKQICPPELLEFIMPYKGQRATAALVNNVLEQWINQGTGVCKVTHQGACTCDFSGANCWAGCRCGAFTKEP